jgi:hypothetical protein
VRVNRLDGVAVRFRVKFEDEPDARPDLFATVNDARTWAARQRPGVACRVWTYSEAEPGT